MKALCKVRLPSRSKKELGIASPSLLVIVIIIQSASTTTGTSSAEAQPCFQPVNNIQIVTSNKSSTQELELNITSIQRQLTKLNDITEQLSEIINLLNQTSATTQPRDCLDVQRAGFNESGQYKVYPDDGGDPFFVFCDMETDGGGWTLFQRREEGTLDFYQNWQTYKNGFGPVSGDHWLGNDRIHRLTFQKRYALRVDLWDWQNQTAFAHYSMFYVAGEDLAYMLIVGGYSGTAGSSDSLAYNNGRKFTTLDRDNDGASNNCAEGYHGAWWYGSACTDTNLNGKYYEIGGSTTSHSDGITWLYWKGNRNPLKKSEMKIRPV